MDAADYDFARIPEFDMKDLNLFDIAPDLQLQCGKKRGAQGAGAEKGVKKVKIGGPVKISREEAAKYWQSLIDAGRKLGCVRRKVAVKYTSDQLRVKVKAVKSLADNEAFFVAMQAKVSLFSQMKATSPPEDVKFSCMHCDKAFTTKTSLGQHILAKHEKQ